MNITELSTAYMNIGAIGLLAIGFFVLLVWVLKASEKRESKLYSVIDILSKELPEIRKTLNELNSKVDRFTK